MSTGQCTVYIYITKVVLLGTVPLNMDMFLSWLLPEVSELNHVW